MPGTRPHVSGQSTRKQCAQHVKQFDLVTLPHDLFAQVFSSLSERIATKRECERGNLPPITGVSAPDGCGWLPVRVRNSIVGD